MLKLIRRPIGPGGRRRGVTLVEMLVVVALVVLMMVILVQIFQSALGAMSASRTVQELDVTLRQVDSIIRSDLSGTTACMSPTAGKNDPNQYQNGYFTYGENSFADAQGEDTDDYMAFTTRAPEGQTFSGRQWLAPTTTPPYVNQNIQPTTINSQVAEVVYFLRNGNLYRRVFLVVPERSKTIHVGTATAGGYQSAMFGGTTNVSWQGMNDISCRPGGFNAAGVAQAPIPNDLGSLTNRENRAFSPRFIDDFVGAANGAGDGVFDDLNADGIADYYPTLYTDGNGVNGAPNGLVHEALPYNNGGRVSVGSYNVYAFPFIYPGMYSIPDQQRLQVANNLGWVHGLLPAYDSTANAYIPNHAALDVGDNLAAPSARQTWWGFPTWRETIAGYQGVNHVGWTDPVNFASANGGAQPLGLQPYPPAVLPMTGNAANLLPPVTVAETGNAPPYADPNAGSASFVAIPAAPNRVWEDDLLLSGVRSFDIKAYDPSAPLYNTATNGYFSAGYQDLGYGAASYVGGPNGVGVTAQSDVPWQATNAEPQGFGHEGRIPPLYSDFRLHPQRPSFYNPSTQSIQPYNIGDSTPGVIRLTRVWDSWSTEYSNAPVKDFFNNGAGATSLALYPSFPPPYPTALRGIQIQIRLVDARGEKAKPLTIRFDFTDKL